MDEFYSLGLLVSRASISLAKLMNTKLEDCCIDLPHSQFIVLRCLYFNDGLSQLEIAKLLSKDAAAIKRTVDNLEKKGFVVRTRVRTLKNAICITDEGKVLMPHVLKIADEVISQALNGIGGRDQTLLRTMLDTIYSNLEDREA